MFDRDYFLNENEMTVIVITSWRILHNECVAKIVSIKRRIFQPLFPSQYFSGLWILCAFSSVVCKRHNLSFAWCKSSLLCLTSFVLCRWHGWSSAKGSHVFSVVRVMHHAEDLSCHLRDIEQASAEHNISNLQSTEMISCRWHISQLAGCEWLYFADDLV